MGNLTDFIGISAISLGLFLLGSYDTAYRNKTEGLLEQRYKESIRAELENHYITNPRISATAIGIGILTSLIPGKNQKEESQII